MNTHSLPPARPATITVHFLADQEGMTGGTYVKMLAEDVQEFFGYPSLYHLNLIPRIVWNGDLGFFWVDPDLHRTMWFDLIDYQRAIK